MKDKKKLIIRIVCLILAVLLLVWIILPIIEVSAVAVNVELPVTGTDTNRGDGDLIVYTPLFGKSTNTNQWGTEATIVDGRCISVSTAGNSEIPANGFVVSGHNSNNDGARQNSNAVADYITVGKYVGFNQKTMRLIISNDPVTITSEYTVQTTVDGFNINRGADQLIIYTEGTSTRTNEWGYELTVQNGVVVSMGGNNSTIPDGDDSFIVSAHGTAIDWIKLNVILGMRAAIQGDQLVFTFDSATMIYELGVEIEEVKKTYQAAIDAYLLIDRDGADAAIKQAEDALKAASDAFETNGDTDALEAAYDEIKAIIGTAENCCIESSPAEYRGVWLRPIQKTTEDVEEYVERLYQAGINLICIETLYDGYMIMPMPEDSLFEQNPNWRGFDMLQAFINACHARNMELHIWLPTYYVGHEPNKASVAYKKPEWVLRDNNGNTLSDTEGDGAFLMLDPANPEVKEFLLSQYRYILNTYDIDGFELDYIRYYGRSENDYGYSSYAISAFQDKYGITPTYDTTTGWWDEWCDLRCGYVTDFVRSMRALIDEIAPDVLLSADVCVPVTTAQNYVYQDYPTWIKEGLLDLIHPMCYDNGYESTISEINALCGSRTLLAVGLGAYVNTLTADDLARQTSMVRRSGGNGSVYFEAVTFFAKGLGGKLSGTFSNAAITPTSDKAAELQKTQMSKRLDLLIEYGLIDEQAKDGILSSLDASTVDDYITDAAAATTLKNDIASYNRIMAVKRSADRKINESIPEGESQTESAPSSDASTDVSDEGTPSIVLLIIISAAVIIIAAVIILIVVIKKKK